MNGIIIGGSSSGCGKTTISCAVMQTLVNRGMKVASFKCGPDYIDPMFHSKVIGTASYNLDPFFCNDDTLRYLFRENSADADISVIEGVMGFYDAVKFSTNSVSLALTTPAVIVIDSKGTAESIGADMKGFMEYGQNYIRGFIFNRLPEKLVPKIKGLCEQMGVGYYGRFPLLKDCTIESRHLGLVTANEIADIKQKLQILAENAEKYLEIDSLIELSHNCFVRNTPAPRIPSANLDQPPVIAVAKDEAFCFIYQENIDLLEKIGCKIKYFSPLHDKELPENIDGIIIPGGYPELYAKQLSENESMLESIRRYHQKQIPIIAECGGFMYVNRTIETPDGTVYKMAELMKGDVHKTEKLSHFGYIELVSKDNNMLCRRDDRIRAHEFHYWQGNIDGFSFMAYKTSTGESWRTVLTTEHSYFGWPHLYFYNEPRMAVRFAKACAEYHKKEYKDNGKTQMDCALR